VIEDPPRPRHQDPREVHLAWVNDTLRSLAAQLSLPLPHGIERLQLVPETYPGTTIPADTYGERRGPWGDGMAWIEYWADLSDHWVNLGLRLGADGVPFIAYASQWRQGAPAERCPENGCPSFNFNYVLPRPGQARALSARL
jgi:hypothetical protein